MSRLICGENLSFSLDCYETQLSNNVLIFGGTGSGKSRSAVCPNIEQMFGSSLIYDPKGVLFSKYEKWLQANGYHVSKLDFSNSKESCHYNPLAYVRTTQDVARLAYGLVNSEKRFHTDPFWDEAARLLLQSVIAYLVASRPKHMQTIDNVLQILEMMCESGELDKAQTPLDQLFAGMRNEDSEMGQFALRSYRQFRVAADKTLRSILITTFAQLIPYTSREIVELTSKNDIDITQLGRRKEVLFVVCSDSEGDHLQKLIRLFFTQALQELIRFADRCENGSLPVPVRFIMDDFACGVSIQGFERSIAVIRSRGISAMIVLQSISQLVDLYGPSGARTIIANCDTLLYMGGSDVETAQEISLRTNLPLKQILYMPLMHSWVFRRGQQPVFVKNVPPKNELLFDFEKEKTSFKKGGTTMDYMYGR